LASSNDQDLVDPVKIFDFGSTSMLDSSDLWATL